MVGDSGPSEPSERSPHTVGTSDSDVEIVASGLS